MRVKHGCMVNMFPLQGQGCLDSERLDVDIRLDQRGQVRR